MTQDQPKNLYEYFSSKGRNLPSWKERAPLYEQLGLGRESDYAGSESQNNKLLQALVTSGATTPTNTRALAFGQDQPPASTSLQPQTDVTGTQDLGTLLQKQLVEALQGGNNQQLGGLEAQRQSLIRKELTAPAYSQQEGQILSPMQQLSLMRQRGSEYEPLLKGIETQIAALKQGKIDKLTALTQVANIATKLGMFGGKEAPKTLQTDQGILQWNKDTGKWEKTGFTKTASVSQSSSSQKPASTAQYKFASFAKRLVQSESLLNNLYKKLEQEGSLKQLWERNAPNILTSSLMQQIQQAERNFLNAKLRQESGAAIGADEFTNGQKQYFATPGDSPEVIKQKEANRKLVIQNMIRSAGPAYSLSDNLQGQEINNDPLGIR